MKAKKVLASLFTAAAVLCLLQISYAVPAGTVTPLHQLDDVPFFYVGTQLALVDCTVGQYGEGSDYPGQYLYTYQITGTSATGLSSFSIPIVEVVDIVGSVASGVFIVVVNVLPVPFVLIINVKL